jgi:hypothetical protein
MFSQPRSASVMLALLLASSAALAGPYLDQPLPGDEPVLFAPGIVSNGMNNRDMAITPDGREIYWSNNLREFGVSVIMVARQTGNGWSRPEVAPFSKDPAFIYLEPAISPDGKQFFYVASRAGEDVNDIWVMDRTGDGWGEARRLGPPVNTPGKEYFPSITRDGTLYYTAEGSEPGTEAIYRARHIDGGYAEPELLPEQVNSGKSRFNAFVAPDESYLIVPVWGRDDSLGSVDYYIVFRNANDEWSEPVNLGPKINSKSGREYAPYVSPDGTYFFFMATRAPADPDAPEDGFSADYLADAYARPENGNSDTYWIDAAFLESLRPEGF